MKLACFSLYFLRYSAILKIVQDILYFMNKFEFSFFTNLYKFFFFLLTNSNYPVFHRIFRFIVIFNEIFYTQNHSNYSVFRLIILVILYVVSRNISSYNFFLKFILFILIFNEFIGISCFSHKYSIDSVFQQIFRVILFLIKFFANAKFCLSQN